MKACFSLPSNDIIHVFFGLSELKSSFTVLPKCPRGFVFIIKKCIFTKLVIFVLFNSQVDYRAKAWICNFCFNRNAVSKIF